MKLDKADKAAKKTADELEKRLMGDKGGEPHPAKPVRPYAAPIKAQIHSQPGRYARRTTTAGRDEPYLPAPEAVSVRRRAAGENCDLHPRQEPLSDLKDAAQRLANRQQRDVTLSTRAADGCVTEKFTAYPVMVLN